MATIPVLKRFHKRFFKIGPGGGLEPASGAIVKFFHLGATATTATTVPILPAQIEIPVFSIGTIFPGDQLQNGANAAELMMVAEVITSPTMKVKAYSLGGSSIPVPQYGRLIRASHPMNLYRDPMGEVLLPTTPTIVVDADGWAEAYLTEFRNDYTVTGGGVTPAVYCDGEGSWVMR